MITGHLGVALAARGCWRRAPLFWLLAASVAPDVLDTALAATGICNPWGLYSHTLPAATVLAAVVGGFVFLVAGGASAGRTAGLLAAGLVLVHLPLDFITGNKLYWPGGELLGLRVYDRPVIDFAIESTLLVGGWMYLRRDARGPAFATSRMALVVALALQGAADLSPRGFKLSACDRLPPMTMQP